MGKRGPGAKRLREAASLALVAQDASPLPLFGEGQQGRPAIVKHPWEKRGDAPA